MLTVTEGSVSSYLNASEPEPSLPALSVQSRLTEAVAESGPSYTAPGSQPAMPLVASEPTAR